MSTYQKQPIPWPDKPVYQLSHEGIKIALMPNGEMLGWTTGHEVISVGNLRFADTGAAWIPKHKNFNSLAKQAFREGDFDQLVRFRARRKLRQQNLKAASEDMYSALKEIIHQFDEASFEVTGEIAGLVRTINTTGRQAMKKAEGQS